MTKLFITTAIAALCVQPAWAEDAADTESVVTASGFEQPRTETGQAITVIDKERLDTLQATSIADALATLPACAWPHVAVLAARQRRSFAAATARRHSF